MARKRGRHDTRSKVALLKLAEELGSVTEACEIMGYSRDSYYRFRRLVDEGGYAALEPRIRTPAAPPNRATQELERKVVSEAASHPEHGPARISRDLRARGISVSPSGVRNILVRHRLQNQQLRLNAVRRGRIRPEGTGRSA